MLIVNGTMRNVTKRIMFADQFALIMKIVTAYHVIPIKGFVIQVRFFKLSITKISLKNTQQYLGIECTSDEDCKGENNKCDLHYNICRIVCTNRDDCNGDGRICDIDRGFCVKSKIQFFSDL